MTSTHLFRDSPIRLALNPRKITLLGPWPAAHILKEAGRFAAVLGFFSAVFIGMAALQIAIWGPAFRR
jgi:hypothetical protein